MNASSWKKYYKLYIGMVLFYGLLLVYLTPAMQSPDENTHFFNSYALSHGQIFAEASESGEIGRTFPRQVGNFIARNSADQAMNLTILQSEITSLEESEEMDFYPYWNADSHLAAYFAPAAGMWLAQEFRVIAPTPYNLLFAGRLANLALFAALSLLAVVTTPVFKRAFMLLFLMPSTISLAASLNYDALLIPTVMLLFAWVTKFTLTQENVRGRDCMLLIFISVVLLAVKQAYFPLLLTVFAVPVTRFKTKKRYVALACICMTAAVVVYAVYKIPSDMILKEAKAVNPLYSGQPDQIAWVLGHIGEIPGIIVRSIMRMKELYIIGFFGYLGKFDIYYVPYYVCVYLLAMAVIFGMELRTGYAIGAKLRILSVIAVLSAVFLIFVGTYIIWTVWTVGVGADWIVGVQGRYFIMLAPFVMLPFCSRYREEQVISERYYSIRDCMFEFGLLYANACLVLAVILVVLKYWR